MFKKLLMKYHEWRISYLLEEIEACRWWIEMYSDDEYCTKIAMDDLREMENRLSYHQVKLFKLSPE